LFGLPTLIAITLWYRLIVTKEEVQNQELDKELAIKVGSPNNNRKGMVCTKGI
jgi:hypothetical protein